MTIKMGSRVKHILNGFTGIVIGRTEWLSGCDRYGVQPEELKDGKSLEPEWFDENMLTVVTEKTPSARVYAETRGQPVAVRGGPQPTPSRQSNPSR